MNSMLITFTFVKERKILFYKVNYASEMESSLTMILKFIVRMVRRFSQIDFEREMKSFLENSE